MENEKTYGIKEAAQKLGISWATIRRRIVDKTLPATFLSRKEGYKITEEALNAFKARLIEQNGSAPQKGSKTTLGKTKSNAKANVKAKAKAAESATKETPKTSKIKTAGRVEKKPAYKKPVAKEVAVSNDMTTQMLVGGQLGIALSAIMGAYSSIGELNLPQEDIKKLIKELNSRDVIDKVIDRLKAEQEYFDIQIAAQELKAKQASKKDEKADAEEKLIEFRLKKNQIGKDITDLELRKTLLA